MGNCYMGISDEKLSKAELEVLKFGYIRPD